MADGMLSLAWNNHSSTFCHMLSTVRNTDRYSDVTIACDGRFYSAHKLVLSTCSDYFHKMFERTPCKHPVIVIKDVECKNMEALLSYMYAGVVNVCQSDLAQLIRAAELLEIKGLAVPDEPPSGTKRQTQTDDSNSPNPKRPRQSDKRTVSREEAPSVVSSGPPSLVSSRKDDNVEEQGNSCDVYDKTINDKPSQSEHRQDRRENVSSSSSSSSRRSEQLDSNHGQDHLKSSGKDNKEVAGESGIKEEKVEPESEDEGADMGFEYVSLMSDLVGDEASKEHPNVPAAASFSQSLSAESYTTEPGPSGLQPWPILSEGVEPGGSGQGFSGGLPLSSHSSQQPHQLQNLVGSEREWAVHGSGQGQEISFTYSTIKKYQPKVHQCPFCTYVTSFHNNLTKHVRIHTGEKPFECSLCPFRANQNSSLKRHMHNIHNEVMHMPDRISAEVQKAPQV